MRSKKTNVWTCRNAKRCWLYYCLYYTSDWFKHQILRNLPRAAWMFIPCFPTNFVITKSRLSLSNTEILCKLFLAIVYHSYDWSKSFNTEKHLSKMKFKYILFHNFTFFLGLCILCVKMKTFLCEKSLLHHKKRNCFPCYQDHYLNAKAVL